MRINQYLARCGVCSRRAADTLINEGRVVINGRKAELGSVVNDSDIVFADGKRAELPADHIVIAYYKPVGVTCTEKDSHADRIVTDEVKADRRVTYAGRLDRDSEGLLLLTDDGSLIDAMMRGSNRHEKEYQVTVNKKIIEADVEKMRSGLYIPELNVKTRPCRINITGQRSFEIILTQGLNRQIRRMCKEVGYSVVSLKRTRIMNVKIMDLQVGASRLLTNEEKIQLYKLCGLKK